MVCLDAAIAERHREERDLLLALPFANLNKKTASLLKKETASLSKRIRDLIFVDSPDAVARRDEKINNDMNFLTKMYMKYKEKVQSKEE